MIETQEQFNMNQEEFNVNQEQFNMNFQVKVENLQDEMSHLQEMLGLRDSNQDPLVDLYYTEGSDKDDMEIDSLTEEPLDTFSMVDKKIKFNPLEDIDDLVLIPRVSEDPFSTSIDNPLFDFDSDNALDFENPIFEWEGHMARQCPKPKRTRDATWFREKVLLVEAQGNGKVLNEEELKFLTDLGIAKGPVTQSVITHNAAYQADDLDAFDSDCDKISIDKAVLMANLSSYGSNVLFEVPISDNTNNDMLNQSVQEMSYSERSHFVEHPENEIHSDSNIISYSQYLIESQNTTVQDTNSSAQQDALILSVFEQLSNQVTNCNKVNNDNLIANESLSSELERYKERKVKELDNIVCKMGQSTQTVHMLMKPQVFYDTNLKQAFGFQNPFYLKKAQQIRPMLYDGSVIAKETNVISIADSKETLMLEEESRSKMLLKQSDPMVLKQKVNIKPINYAELNRLSKYFGKHFVPQQELSDKQAFQLQTLHPNTDQSTSSPVKIEAPRELPKYHVDKQPFEIQKKQFLIENDRLLDQIISQDILNIVVNSSLDINTFMNVKSSVAMNDSVNYVEMSNKCLKLKAELIKQHNMVEKDEYNSLSKSFSKLEQHCISLELAMQLNKEIFQKKNTYVNQTEPSFDQLFELNNLKAELQAKDTTIEKLKANIKRKSICHNSIKNDLRKLKGKEITDNVAQMRNVTTIAPRMYKLDLVILAPKVKNNKEAHEYYLNHTMEQAVILREVVEQAKSRNPLDSASYSACMYVKLIQELLGYVSDTCPDIHKPKEKLVGVTPINKKKTVRFADAAASSSNMPKVTNRPLLSFTGVKPSTSASGSKPSGNTKNDRISRTPSSNEKNKVEVQSRKVKSKLNKQNSDSKNVCNEHVKHAVKGAQDLCSKNRKRKEWKPIGKVFNSVGYKWKPTGRTFTLVGNACPLTRITTTNKVPRMVPIPLEVVAPEHIVTRVYTRRPKVPKSVPNSKPMVAKSMTANRIEPGTSRGFDTSVAPSSSSLINYRLSKLFCDLEVAFRKHTCFVHNLEGVDLLSGSQRTNMYSLSIGDMMASSPICLLSKATKTKSWLWHRRLSHLNFGALNHLARNGLVRGLPRLKFKKDHLCSACAMGKSNKQSHKPKSKDTNQEKLYLLHMDLYGPMRVTSVNGKRNIRTDNGTEFVNQTLRNNYEQVGISHETSVARTPQQNGLVERWNHTLVEAARTIKLNLSYLRVFGARCYRNNDSENLGKLQAKADIGIFIGYTPKKKAYRNYNRRARKIIETIHVDFDKLMAMASEQSSLEPALHEMTPATPSSRLVPNPPPSAPFVPPSRHEWDLVFQPLFDEFFSPPSCVSSLVPVEEASC
ncbi:retrovirus-related pol polyprotein from transposon TNT 1-94 [Tanacetum coccineum]|uniref:Retrovirus-related pol polyprotein from transposon TNT 1-94 n=1 Tax=Tanacetum coccineum TaxID=301880 RepID=A0ABQ5EHI4_9ASTR